MADGNLMIQLAGAVGIALAALYAFVPMFNMPGSALVWGSGAVISLGLTLLVARAEGRWVRSRAKCRS